MCIFATSIHLIITTMAKRLSTLLLLISVFTTLSAQHSTELGFYPVFTTLEFSEVLEKFPTTIKQKIIYRDRRAHV